MRFIFLTFFLLTTLLSAQEIQRIESIVDDITKLQNSYVSVKNELNDEKEKSRKYVKKINSLEKEIITLKKEVKTKENNLVTSDKTKSLKSKNQIKRKKCLNSSIRREENTFTILAMKGEYTKKEVAAIHYVKASTYRVNKLAYIYKEINGEVIDEWEEQRSFTSNKKSNGWIKITGYFINKLWIPADTSLWIESRDANMRIEQ